MMARARGAIGAALVAVALVAIAFLVLASPVFEVSAVEVEGNARLSDDEVVAMSGTGTGDNLVFLSSRDVEEALESSPWISDAVVERRFPDMLVIRLVERRPVAWAGDGSTPYLVADDGTVVAAANEPAALPWLGRYADLEQGELLPGPLAPVRVLATLPPSVTRTIETAGMADGVLLRFSDGSYVRYGPPTELRRKAAALEAVLAWAGERGIAFRYVDVRVPESPVLRPAGKREREVRPAVVPAP